MNLSIRIEDSASPRLAAIIRALRGPGREALLRAAGAEVQRVTAAHLAARPGSHWKRAAEKAAQPAALQTGADAAILTIAHPGITRAFRDITIRPVEAQSLAIPIHPMARRFRAAELWQRMRLFIPRGGRVIAATIGGALTPLYILAKRAHQPQDRSLLPSDAEFQTAAARGAMAFLARARAAAANT